MKILFIHGHMFHGRTWHRAADQLAHDGIDLAFVPQQEAGPLLKRLESGKVAVLIGDLIQTLPFYEEIWIAAKTIPYRLCLDAASIQKNAGFSESDIQCFHQYLEKVDRVNFTNGIRFLAACAGLAVDVAPPRTVLTEGIYHPDACRCFSCVEDYFQWYADTRPPKNAPPTIAVWFHYSQIAEENTADIDTLCRTLEANGFLPLCCFTEGAQGRDGSLAQRYPWIGLLDDTAAKPRAVLNFLAGRILSRPEDITLLEMLDVPIIQMIRNYRHTPEMWRKDPVGLNGHGLVYSLSQPEMAGVVEPTMTAGVKKTADDNVFRLLPVKERMTALCRRLSRWVRLQDLPNPDKRVTIVLHNNPCKGVEATVGAAVGLDTFDSLRHLLAAMAREGYDVDTLPASGREILETIMVRKALSEFRWTTVDEIVKKGGVLHFMGRREYEGWLETVPVTAREKIITDWGPFPGEGMAWKKEGEPALVITGIRMGNVQIMVQPKRGCYGAKCNGEVCRILHDPQLSAPHQYLATYKYIRDTSDVVIHLGTEGSLEYLPGKRTALSDACFPEIALGDLPNLYVYVMDATGEGLTAKRRGRAVLVDHLTPVYRPARPDEALHELESLIVEFFRAEEMGELQRGDKLLNTIKPLLSQLKFDTVTASPGNWSHRLGLVNQRIQRIKNKLAPRGLHLLGHPPDHTGMAEMMAAVLHRPPEGVPHAAEIARWVETDHPSDFDAAAAYLEALMTNGAGAAGAPDRENDTPASALQVWQQEFAGKIAAARQEIPQLLRALEGRYIAPVLSGAVSSGKPDVLPTGRNFFATDVMALPTGTAWEIGMALADKLLIKFLTTENRFPETVGISIWSADAFKSDGELVSQILYLMGVAPERNAMGRISGIRVIPLDSLTLRMPDGKIRQRPRVDVTIQTSGIMRDLVPHFCEIMDLAAVTVSRLQEPETMNFIRKHTQADMVALRENLGKNISESQLRRTATLRVFSSAPGAYGSGVGLALDASAWQDEKDLAEAYINWGGYGFGADPAASSREVIATEAQEALARQMARLEIAYMKQHSAEYDILDCGCYAVFQGGMAATAAAMDRQRPKLYWGDATQPDDLDVRDVEDEIHCAARARLLSKKWIQEMKNHGRQGAQAVSGSVNTLYKWSATSQVVEKGLFDAVVETYLMDEENLQWLRSANPHALEEITRRLLEACSRNLWRADAPHLAAVQNAALAVEGDMEDAMGEVEGEFQGGKVEVMTADAVEKWDYQWRINARGESE